jgi:hypothetical protein
MIGIPERGSRIAASDQSQRTGAAMTLAVVRSIDAPQRQTGAQEAEDFEQELVDQYRIAGMGAGLAVSTLARERVALFDFIHFLGHPVWTAQAHGADRYFDLAESPPWTQQNSASPHEPSLAACW